jgi:uncharacterized damage-inducible protein DinB
VNFNKAYDYLYDARAKLFDWIRPLSQEQYTQQFPIGLRTLRATMLEIAAGEWSYGRRIEGHVDPAPDRSEWPISEQRLPTFADLERAWGPQAAKTRAILSGVTDWDTPFEYRSKRGEEIMRFMGSRADIAMQMCFHEVHHRAQAMAMLRQLGVNAQNLDYSVIKIRRLQ